MEMTERTEEIFVQIEKKCKKKYSSDYSIELLAYYISQPSSNSFDWQSRFHDYVLKILSGCPFERVWVYDHWGKAIKYVHPDLDKGAEHSAIFSEISEGEKWVQAEFPAITGSVTKH